jgi:curved DNA-binding protein CbpA
MEISPVPKQNFYERLSVPMRAEPQEIWRAYQRISFRIDPEAGARPDPEQFREVQDAYRVLCDPGRRRAYDIELATRRRPFSAEPPRWKKPVTVPDDFLTITPSIEELLDHVAQNFIGYRRKSSGPYRWLGLEAILRPDDVRFGCHLPVRLFQGGSRVLFEIPRDTCAGEHFEMDLGGIGIHNLALQIHVVVGE